MPSEPLIARARADYVADRIDLGEFEERVDAALACSAYDELVEGHRLAVPSWGMAGAYDHDRLRDLWEYLRERNSPGHGSARHPDERRAL